MKFRVNFVSADDMAHFCAAISGYVTVKSFEEWGANNLSTQSFNSTIPAAELSMATTLSTTLSSIKGGHQQHKTLPRSRSAEMVTGRGWKGFAEAVSLYFVILPSIINFLVCPDRP